MTPQDHAPAAHAAASHALEFLAFKLGSDEILAKYKEMAKKPGLIGKMMARAQAAQQEAERLKRDGVDPVGSTPETFGALITREIKEWRDLAQSSKITLD